jgi:hypothetical protein
MSIDPPSQKSDRPALKNWRHSAPSPRLPDDFWYLRSIIAFTPYNHSVIKKEPLAEDAVKAPQFQSLNGVTSHHAISTWQEMIGIHGKSFLICLCRESRGTPVVSKGFEHDAESQFMRSALSQASNGQFR